MDRETGSNAHTHAGQRPAREGDLVYAVEVRTYFRGGGNRVVGMELGDSHLRFQRTLPSRESSNSIPRSASSLRMRSDSAKSRRCRAAWRSATNFSISPSLGPASPPYPSAFNLAESLSSSTANTLSNVAR